MHGAAETKRCSHEGCAAEFLKGGICWTHGAQMQ